MAATSQRNSAQKGFKIRECTVLGSGWGQRVGEVGCTAHLAWFPGNNHDQQPLRRKGLVGFNGYQIQQFASLFPFN